MTNQHPLTEEIMYKIRGYGPGYSNPYDEDDMQAAADWQLEQDQKRLEDFLEDFMCRGHGHEANDEVRDFVNNFKSYMRPQQQESN